FVEPVDPFIEDIVELQPQDAHDVVIVGDVDDDAIPASKRKRGRSAGDIWNHFTVDVDPQKVKRAKCKHFKPAINPHKKSEYAKRYLKLVQSSAPS
ncbi:hypothetical protein H310_15182, partial [Aphanomyces invadans]